MMEFLDSISTEEEYGEIANMMFKAYVDDPTMLKVYKGKPRLSFFETVVHYYAIWENILIAKEEGKICGAILWNKLNDDVINVNDLFKNGLLKIAFRFVWSTPLLLLLRVI